MLQIHFRQCYSKWTIYRHQFMIEILILTIFAQKKLPFCRRLVHLINNQKGSREFV